MSGGLAFFSVCFPSLFSIVDPIGVVPVYLALVGGEPRAEQRRIATRAVITATIVLILFAATGTAIFRLFGITVPAFKVAGGVLLATMALEMMRARTSTVKSTPEETSEAQAPRTTSPSRPSASLSSPGRARSPPRSCGRRARMQMSEKIALYASIVMVTGITFVTLLFASRLVQLLGKTGINVITRIMGLILAATAAQFVIDGWREAMAGC